MATDGIITSIPGLIAAADLSSYQYRIVKLSAARTVTYSSADADAAIGILQDKPAAANRAANVAGPGSVSKLKLGSGGCTFGQQLTSDASGQGVVASASQRVVAQALETGDEGDIISVLITLSHAPAA